MSQLTLFPDLAPVPTPDAAPPKRRRGRPCKEDTAEESPSDVVIPRALYRSDADARIAHPGKLANALCSVTHVSARTIRVVLDGLSDYVANGLAQGYPIEIPGLGTVSTKVFKEHRKLLANGDNGPLVERVSPVRRKVRFSADRKLVAKANRLTSEGDLPIFR